MCVGQRRLAGGSHLKINTNFAIIEHLGSLSQLRTALVGHKANVQLCSK